MLTDLAMRGFDMFNTPLSRRVPKSRERVGESKHVNNATISSSFLSSLGIEPAIGP